MYFDFLLFKYKVIVHTYYYFTSNVFRWRDFCPTDVCPTDICPTVRPRHLSDLYINRTFVRPRRLSDLTFVQPNIRMCVNLSVCPSVHPSVRPSVRPFVRTSVCLSVCPSVLPAVLYILYTSLIPLSELRLDAQTILVLELVLELELKDKKKEKKTYLTCPT